MSRVSDQTGGVHDGGKGQHQSSGLVSVDAHFHISHTLAAFSLCPSPRHIRVEIIMDVHFKPPDLSNYYLTNLGWDYQVHKAVARSVLLQTLTETDMSVVRA